MLLLSHRFEFTGPTRFRVRAKPAAAFPKLRIALPMNGKALPVSHLSRGMILAETVFNKRAGGAYA